MQSAIQFINFLDAHSGSLTFLITAIYVVATILICWANISSANATKKQILQSESQFEETQRLGMIPYLTLEHIKDETLDADIEVSVTFTKEVSVFCHHSSLFRLKNIGNGTATTITYTWRCTEKDICEANVINIRRKQFPVHFWKMHRKLLFDTVFSISCHIGGDIMFDFLKLTGCCRHSYLL